MQHRAGSRWRRAPWTERLAWLGAGMVLGLSSAGAAALASVGASPDTVYEKLEILAEVIAHVETYYVDAVSPQDLMYGAARGVVGTLDAHSMFFPPEEYRELLDATEGEYAGIGVEIDVRDDAIEVIAVLDDSPAQRAGVVRGDRIVAVDGQALLEASFDAVQRLLRGPVGTSVVLEVARGDRTWTYTLVRGWIRVPPLSHRLLPGGVHYVQLKTFSRRVASDLDRMLSEGGGTAFILDLRNNPGGLFDEAVDVCDLFLSEGPVVSTTGKGGRLLERRMAHERTPFPSQPLAILIDRGSASAAEIVAGALHDRGRARLFGERSYGKGSVQSILDLSDGSGLKLTLARYITPSGLQIDGTGIEPDEHTVSGGGDGKDGDDGGDREVGEDETFQAALTWITGAR